MSKYKPYRSFEEWGVEYQKKHGKKFTERAQLILGRLKEHSVNHPGKKFKADKIADSLGLSRTQVNASIRYLRNNLGYPICSDGDGYWFSTNKEDIQNTINHFQDRIYAMQFCIDNLQELL